MSAPYRVGGKIVSRSTENEREKRIKTASRNVNEDKNNVYKIYKLEEMPEYLRFNPYIKDGYRGQMTLRECCQSLLFFHNETINIYTHGGYFLTFVLEVYETTANM